MAGSFDNLKIRMKKTRYNDEYQLAKQLVKNKLSKLYEEIYGNY